jgi:hypothetical protein
MTKVLSRKACTYGAAARIQCTNARIVAELTDGVSSSARAIDQVSPTGMFGTGTRADRACDARFPASEASFMGGRL